ncbi:MAG: CRTAC1 family protein [Fuerstiella sp.]|nr:CRTAC1 family protein [Fuerstiella sp.]MCP4505409.1 CRTAC1 family protein [Fuerstiella sp.]
MLQRYASGLIFGAVIWAASGCNSGKPNGETETSSGSQTIDRVPAAVTKEQYARAIAVRSRGVGQLENKEWPEAEKSFVELTELLPGNRLAVRNLAVSRVLSLIDRESPFKQAGTPAEVQAYQEAVENSRQAVTKFRQASTDEYDTALADMLMGKLLVHDDSPESPSITQGLTLLRNAADALPQAADFRFALAMAMDGHRDYADSPELLIALQKSFELAPQNLFALQKLMQRQALSLNSKNENTRTLALRITETLKAARTLIAPLNESIRKQRRMDLVGTITKALDEFDGTNAPTLMGPAMMTGNLLLPELATQIDQRRLNRNLLEYLLLEFDAEFLAAARATGAIPAAEPTVVKAFLTTDSLPPVKAVTQVELLDMNLDGFDDLIVAREGGIEVYSRGTNMAAEWTLLMKSPEQQIHVTEFLLADIDRDFDKAISDIKNPSLLRDADGDQKIVTDPAGLNRWYDTDADIIAWGSEGVVVFRNQMNGDAGRSLNVLPQEQAVPAVNDIVAADLEADGDLDLIFATDAGMTLWKNIDGTVFENINSSASLPEHGLQSLAVVDWNSDVAMDVVGVSADGTTGCLENMLHGRFRWIPINSDRVVANDVASVTCCHVVGPGADGRTLLWCSGAGADDQSNWFGNKVVVADLDNDGAMDTVNCHGIEQPLTVSILPETVQPATASSGTAADIDDDGDLDIIYVSASDGTLGLLTNDGGNSNNWIDVVARAVPDDPQFPSNRVNMHGIGSVIEVRAGSLYHAEVVDKPKLHLGLGKAESADAIRIIWTDGIPQNITVPNLLRKRIGVLAPQILKGSCPYIYTWTGERFEFFSDCLWAAPLGLVQASGEIAPTREWENLLIRGESLVQKDGRYMLQLTEELWETAYFDQVQLTAIDHPANVDIFSNEKVGSPDMATHRIHTVRHPRSAVSITDGRGNNLLPGLAAADGHYVQAFKGRIMQGLTDEWTLEFDLGDLTDQEDALRDIRLFLVGWVFPTDTSLNLGIAQNPAMAGPAGPSIEVPAGAGGWKVVRPFIGFPSGKTKAMVVDISDIFVDSDYRFRIRSSMELYWDHAFFTVNEETADTMTQPCPLLAADLHFRGFSRRIYADNALFRRGRAPESYDYAAVTTAPRWPTIHGRFTRYGESTALLTDHDDQMVVMGPGDELTMEFAVPTKPVPDGWKRDFVLTNVGYDKDADLNTIYGQSSEPFPFRAMSRYPFSPDDQVPNTAEYRQYVDGWQTREYSLNEFRDALRKP